MIDPTTSATCPVCGATASQCGGSVADVVPVDIPMTEVKIVSELRLYEVVVNGYATRMKLNQTEAERMGGKAVEEGDTEQVSAEDTVKDGAGTDTPAVRTKARQRTANRARGAEDDK